MISRSSKHIQLAEYTGSFFDVYIVRGQRTTNVTEYTANIPAITRQLESEVDGYGRAIQGRISITFNNDIWDLIQPLPEDASEIGIVIKHRRHLNSETYKLHYGVAEDLPSAVDSYSNDQLIIQFVSIFSTLADGDDLVDPNTGEEYEYIKVDELIDVFDALYNTNYNRQVAGVPIKVSSDIRWWSAYFRPFKKRILENETYDNTIKPKSIISDGTDIYYPIHDWIVQYNPETDTEKIITKIGSGNECLYLEYDSGDIHYVTREDIGRRGYGSFTISTVGQTVSPTEIFYKYDEGIDVYAKNILKHNHRTSGDADPALATWDSRMIGDGVIPPDKNLSGGRPFRGVKADTQVISFKGNNFVFILPALLDVPDGAGTDWINFTGWHCQAEETTDDRFQDLGLCTGLERAGDYIKVSFEKLLEIDLITATFFAFPPEIWPTPNLMIPAHMSVSITYDKDELSDRDMQSVVIEKRNRPTSKGSFYYPDRVGELSEGDELFLPPGYYSFTSCDTAQQFTNILGHEEWKADTCASFHITLDWIDRQGQYLLADNFRVENDQQPNSEQLYGPNKVTLSGVQTKWNNGEDVKSYGNIYLYKDANDKIYVGVNEIRQAKNQFYTRIKFGVWVSALQRFAQFYVNRHDDDFQDVTNYQLSSPFVTKNDIVYGGAELIDRNWVNTGLQIIYARPPQAADAERPTDYDGGYTAVILVVGDHTDLFEAGNVLQVGASTAPLPKEYFISEVSVVTVALNDTGGDYTVSEYRDLEGKVTRIFLKSIANRSEWDKGASNPYQNQINLELLGKYVTVAQGWDIQSVSYKLDSTFTIIDTATKQYGEEPEGKDDDLGEILTVEYDDDWDDNPRMSLSEERVLTGVKVFLKKQEFIVTDFTDELRVTEPPVGEAYVKRNQGSEFNTTFVYLNDIYTNMEIRVEYEYYPDEIEFDNFTFFKDEIYYAEGNEWKVYNPALASLVDDFSIGINEEGFYSNLVECNNRLYGFTEPSYTLRQYHTDWSGYIELAETEGVRAWDILGRISSACNNSLYELNGNYYFKRRDNFKSRGEILHGTVHKTIIPPFRKVEITYANGKAIVGEGEPVYSRSCPSISDYKHALIVAQEVYNFNRTGIGKYELEILFRDDIEMLDMFGFEHEGERVSGYTVGLDFNPSPPWISKLTLYETLDAQRSLI